MTEVCAPPAGHHDNTVAPSFTGRLRYLSACRGDSLRGNRAMALTDLATAHEPLEDPTTSLSSLLCDSCRRTVLRQERIVRPRLAASRPPRTIKKRRRKEADICCVHFILACVQERELPIFLFISFSYVSLSLSSVSSPATPLELLCSRAHLLHLNLISTL